MAIIINGNEVAQELRNEVAQKAKLLGRKPGLAVVLVGNDPASRVYVNSKEKACLDVGFYSVKIVLPENTPMSLLQQNIEQLNLNPDVDAILVQLPLPAHLDESQVINLIDPKKDVDCLHPANLGKLIALKSNYDLSRLLAPCTPKGIIRLIKSTGEQIAGKRAVVIGRSQLVGKPVALLLLAEDATVTICHSQTQDLIQECLYAQILISAVGRPHLVTDTLVSPGAIVVDVGINRTQEGLTGDVDYKSVEPVAGYLTPVPGGVGPMTIACLLENTLILSQNAQA